MFGHAVKVRGLDRWVGHACAHCCALTSDRAYRQRFYIRETADEVVRILSRFDIEAHIVTLSEAGEVLV